MKQYKVWFYIEEIDHEKDHYEDKTDIPECTGYFDTEEEAQQWVKEHSGVTI